LLFGSLVAFIRSFRGPASTLLQAYDQFSFLSSVTLKSSLITVPLSFFGILEFGLEGALVVMLVGELLIAVPIIRRARQLLFLEKGKQK
jgi:O-antigen/teichoic acid export membrane protein